MNQYANKIAQMDFALHPERALATQVIKKIYQTSTSVIRSVLVLARMAIVLHLIIALVSLGIRKIQSTNVNRLAKCAKTETALCRSYVNANRATKGKEVVASLFALRHAKMANA